MPLSRCLTCEGASCHIHRFRRASRVARPSQGGERRTAVWTSRHEDLGSAWVVSPSVADPRIPSIAVWFVLGAPPPGAAVDAGLDAVARGRRAERAADGGVLSVPHGLDVAKGTANACATRWPDSPLIAPVTAYHHRSCVETYRRSIWNAAIRGDLTRRCPSARSCSTDWA